GRALAEQGQAAEGIAQLRQGLAVYQATGAEVELPGILAALAEMQGKVGHVAEGLHLLDEATAMMGKNENRNHAELYRIKGQLTLEQLKIKNVKLTIAKAKCQSANTQEAAEAEGCFLQALAVARKQQAKSLELRAAMSLARLWQQQGKK